MSAPFIIGVISDTHGLLRPEAVAAMRGSNLILHAGDIGAPEIIPELRRIAPVIAIRGNIDGSVAHSMMYLDSIAPKKSRSNSAKAKPKSWTDEFQATEVAEAAGHSFYILHSVRELDLNPKAAGFSAVVFGHSHKPEFYYKDDVLFFNPGSAGPRRFSLPISLGRITVCDDRLEPELITLEI